jgi:hypothetical protein
MALLCKIKKWRGTRILHGDMTFMSFRWDFGVASDQLNAQPHNRSNSEKKTSHNFE